MLQSASDWWYGPETKDPEDDTNDKKESNDDDTDAKTEIKQPDEEDEEVEIEFEKELDSISCVDVVLSLFKLTDFEKVVQTMISKQFPDDLTDKERTEIYELFSKIHLLGVTTKSKLTVYSELKIGFIILSYFASLSATNPNAFGCWNRWVTYRRRKDIRIGLQNVKAENLEKFYATKSNEFGYDNKGRLIWFVSTKDYDGFIDDDTQRKGYMSLLMSFLWDIKTNTFDLKTLRGGVQSHIDVSHFSMSLISWSTVYAIKDCLVAFPYQLNDIFIVNPPMLVYLVKTVAAQFFVAHALDKFILLDDEQHYFREYASKDKTPTVAKGTSNLVLSEWIKQKGYQ
eukprot:232057_1